MKICGKCNVEFNGYNTRKYCDECKKSCINCGRPIKNQERGISCSSCRQKKWVYGHSNEDLAYIFNKTDCDCCGNEFKNHKDKSQDHCHTTGNLRGIICQRCNWAVGMYETTEKDNIINYLIKFTQI